MPAPQKDPLRRLTAAERRDLGQLRRSRTAPAAEVTRATLILLVSDGRSCQGAARAVGRRSGDAVARLVARFNTEGLAAMAPRHGGGRALTYGGDARDRILREVARRPTPEQDGAASWSLSTLRRVLRTAADGLPGVSTYTIWRALREAGYSFQRTRTWCPTGRAVRRRKAGRVTVTDPDAGAKKS
jgi:transposase